MSYLIFDIMKQVLKFDFFELEEYFDLNFTKTEPWNRRFGWLDYESSNFFELLGSLNLYIIFILFQATLIIPVHCLKVDLKFSLLKRIFSLKSLLTTITFFFIEALFELLLCGLISFKMFKVRQRWNTMDKVAVSYHFVSLGLTIFFIILVTRSLISKHVHIVNKAGLKSLIRHEKRVLSDRAKYMQRHTELDHKLSARKQTKTLLRVWDIKKHNKRRR